MYPNLAQYWLKKIFFKEKFGHYRRRKIKRPYKKKMPIGKLQQIAIAISDSKPILTFISVIHCFRK